ncbi:MAG TPA: fatty acid desaturase [Bacteroidia bacterium]|jgi:omega-6 fatty acid desaturase (delta-12 desaturase)|nr:fatty acid desaturase [Bacteroidia bacterium]
MLQGKELILATKPFAKEIRWKSWLHTLVGFVLLTSFLLGTYFSPSIYGRLICSVCSALLLSRVFIIFHDYQHHTILQKSIIAEFLFTIFGIYMITPPSIWKRSHDHHHANNAKLYSASIGSYPIMTKQKFMEASPSERFFYLAVRHPLNMFFAYFTTFMYGMCIQSFLSSFRRHWDSLLVLIIHFSIAVLLFVNFGWLTWFLTFFLPFFLSHMLGAYLFYAQHNFPGVIFNANTTWNYADAALKSSSYMKMNQFWRWVTANIGYHHIHHLNSRIPFYRLPEAMAAIPELQTPIITTLNPGDMLRCLRLKVWDAEQNKMIGYSQMETERVLFWRRAVRA